MKNEPKEIIKVKTEPEKEATAVPASSSINEIATPMILDELEESELPQRGRPSKILLIAQQQQQLQKLQLKEQDNAEEIKADIVPKQEPQSVETEEIKQQKAEKENVPKQTKYVMKQRQPQKPFHRSVVDRPPIGRPRKLSKKHAAQLTKPQTESFVMKLFDRSLDLSKYDDKTPLYPICRAWTANQPRNANLTTFNKNVPPIVKREANAEEILEKLRSGEIKKLTQMPLPNKSDMSPVPPPLAITPEEIEEARALKNASRDELLSAHIKRWRRVKDQWQVHVHSYEKERFGQIFQIIELLNKG